MSSSPKKSAAVDQYIAGFPKDVQVVLEKVRATIRKTAPQAEETIGYHMPAYVFHGNLVYFAGFKSHIGFYPIPSGIEKFRKELSVYKQGKGSVQFPLDRPIPYGLITKIVKYRMQENLKKEAAAVKKKK